ncbi:histidine kinase [uncultured Chitinophaga sp.]|uniref:sensor histidine kinase n=1 Tax=uncultured Chitinophaga sp. TaxID=339340 RepID=UPI002608C3CF|nr:histidine kinase [uncultured Chitinophaga sp.]
MLWHLLVLILALGIPLVILPAKNEMQPDYFNPARITFTLIQIGAFYLNVYYFFPRFLLKGQAWAYLWRILTVCAGILLLQVPLELWFPGETPRALSNVIIIKFFASLMIIGAGTGYAYIEKMIRDQRLQQEELKTELSFLRSQVSPHFMFNTLNSMVALARKRSDKLEPALIELSNLMHYMLYESDQEKVSLSKEITYLQSYIDLQTLRFGHQVQIVTSMQCPPEERFIEPMLLIPLIENAFKHGIGLIEDPEINITLNIDGNCVSLEVRNKYNLYTREVKDKVAGIGLNNLVRRLKLLYPGRHEILAEKKGHWFNASLKIQLQ